MSAFVCRACPAALVVGERAARRHVLAHPGHSLSPVSGSTTTKEAHR